jgi:hypothetical protein
MIVSIKRAGIWLGIGFSGIVLVGYCIRPTIRARELAREQELTARYVPSPIKASTPSIDLTTLKGEHLTSANLIGKTVVINFWGAT